MTAYFPAGIVDPTQAMFFTWPALLVVGGIGLFGVRLAGRTGFPEPWAARIPNRRRLLLPLLIGAAVFALFAAIAVGQTFFPGAWVDILRAREAGLGQG